MRRTSFENITKQLALWVDAPVLVRPRLAAPLSLGALRKRDGRIMVKTLEREPEPVLFGKTFFMARRITSTAGLHHVSGIYAIRLDVDARTYVGSSVDLKGRIHQHRHELRENSHDNSYLQRAWSKHGEDGFSFWLLSLCHPEHLQIQEGMFMSDTGACDRAAGFNIDVIAIRKRHSEETKEKIRQSNTGRVFSPETRARIGAANRGNKHPPRTKEQRENHRRAILGRKATPEARANMSKARMGRIITPEWRRNLSLAAKGKPKSPETRLRMKAAQARRKAEYAEYVARKAEFDEYIAQKSASTICP